MQQERVLKITNVRVLRDGALRQTDLWVVDGKIIDPQVRFWSATVKDECAPTEVVDGRGGIVAPGFVDLQLNGGFGVDFSNPSITKQQINMVAQRLVATGVTAFCPTIVSSSADVYKSLLPKYQRTSDGGTRRAANILGVHLEGPFINPERKGAHNVSVLATPTRGLASLLECYGTLENAAIVTLAPELDGALETIEELRQQGTVVSVGHSQASIDTAIEAIQRGASMITHLFNAMGPFHHRDPGLVGLLGLTQHRPFYGLILDGVHSHATSARIVQTCHPEGLVLVTDAMAGMGLSPGTYDLADQRVDVKTNGAFLAGTATIAGSIVTMDSCVRALMAATNCSVEQALEAASLHPAQVLGVEKYKGTLAFGANADFVLLNDRLEVMRTYIAGELAYDNF